MGSSSTCITPTKLPTRHSVQMPVRATTMEQTSEKDGLTPTQMVQSRYRNAQDSWLTSVMLMSFWWRHLRRNWSAEDGATMVSKTSTITPTSTNVNIVNDSAHPSQGCYEALKGFFVRYGDLLGISCSAAFGITLINITMICCFCWHPSRAKNKRNLFRNLMEDENWGVFGFTYITLM